MSLKHVVLLCCILLYGCEVILRISFQPLTDVFAKHPFLMDRSQTTNLITCFYVGYGLLQIPVGLILQILSSEITLIVPVFISGICAQLLVLCETYSALLAIRFLIGVSQASCFLSTLCIIQQYFSLKQFSFYSGLLLLIGNFASTYNLLQTHLLIHHQIWKTPMFALGVCMQCLCIILLVIYCFDRKRIINEIRNGQKQRNLKQSTGSKDSEVGDQEFDETPSWKLWTLPRDQLIEIKHSVAVSLNRNDSECSKITIGTNTPSDVSEGGVREDEEEEGDSEEMMKMESASMISIDSVLPSYRERAISALTNRYTYLFAVVYGILCIAPTLLGAMWLKTYLVTKWPETKNQLVITEHDGQIINVMTFIGAGMGSILFGWISRRYHDCNPFIHRQLCCTGFLLQGTILMVIYVPSSYFSYWGLVGNAFIHGMGMGAIPILFAGTREANDATKSSDVASSIVGTICVGPITLSGIVFGRILITVHGDDALPDHKTTEAEFNKAFLFVAMLIVIGLVTSCFIPRNDGKKQVLGDD